jgi:hypothetical protein
MTATWLMLMVLIGSDPVQPGDKITFALPGHWFATELECTNKAEVYADHFAKTTGAHVAYACFQPPPHDDDGSHT